MRTYNSNTWKPSHHQHQHSDTLDYPEGLTNYLKPRWLQVDAESLQTESWNLVDRRVQKLLDKIKAAGKPLGEYVKGNIFYGIKTGLNEAFVIDAASRARLIPEDPNSAEINKPFLAGRDIKRYQQPVKDKYLLFTRRGIIIENYSAVLKHLEQYRERLEPKLKNYTGREWTGRKEGTYKWYEIQDAVIYYEEFEKPEIMLPDISIRAEALYDITGNYCVNTAYIIPIEERHLTAILNFKVSLYFYASLSSTTSGGYFRFIRRYMEQIPIPKMLKENEERTHSGLSGPGYYQC